MKVNVKLFGPMRKYRAEEEFSVELADGGTVANLLDAVGIEERIYLLTLVNNRRCDEEKVLQDGDIVHISSPVGGG